MFVDARSVPAGTVIETEICIVGGGAAGITVAHELVNAGHSVVLLESGAIEFKDSTQQLYAGTNIGRRYFDPADVALRLRYLGGSSNHWGGWCAIPDELDFEVREGVPYSGWPFPRATLERWYQRAHEILQLGPYGYAPSDWGIADIPEPFNGPHFICEVLQLSPPTRFAEVYGPELRQASLLTVYLNANALRFNAGEGNDSVKDLSVGVLPDGRLTVRAQIYVLAAGGIENARLLLLSGKQGSPGLGNDCDLVGRFFMVHMEYHAGVIALANPEMNLRFATGEDGAFYDRSGTAPGFVSYISLSEATRRERRLPNLRVILNKFPVGEHYSQSLVDLRSVLGDIYRAEFADVFVDLRSAIRDASGQGDGALLVRCSSEQLPSPESRIELGSTTDPFGSRTVTVNWQPTAQDKKGMADAHQLLGAEVGRAGFGRYRSYVPDDSSTWPKRMYGNQHHIGTTRMHKDPRSGVVDENCRIHGVANLYVAGSSVFPTEGIANPTLTIVALAVRLAEHIKEQLK
jgi:choline dehydrogenase-like flavoprotein